MITTQMVFYNSSTILWKVYCFWREGSFEIESQVAHAGPQTHYVARDDPEF